MNQYKDIQFLPVPSDELIINNYCEILKKNGLSDFLAKQALGIASGWLR